MANLSPKLEWNLANPRWASILNPLISNPLNNASVLKNIQLKSGVNVVNHLLGQTQQGWYFTDIDAAITAYRSAPFNNLTLTLTCSGPATVSIAVY